jgi:hypothetical protein
MVQTQAKVLGLFVSGIRNGMTIFYEQVGSGSTWKMPTWNPGRDIDISN